MLFFILKVSHLISYDVEHLSICLFVICISSLVVSVKVFSPFLVILFVSLLLSFKVLCIVQITVFIRYDFCKYVLPVCGFSLYSLDCLSQSRQF